MVIIEFEVKHRDCANSCEYIIGFLLGIGYIQCIFVKFLEITTNQSMLAGILK